MQIVTVPGGTGVTIALPFTTQADQQAAAALLQGLYDANPSLVHVAYADTGFDNAIPGMINELVDSVAGQVSIPSGYQYLVGDYVTAASAPYPVNSFVGSGVFDGATLELSGSGVTYLGGTGAVTIVAGGSVNFTAPQTGSGGGTLWLDGPQMQTVDLASGNWSVETGTGPGSIALGSGSDTITVLGADTITGNAALATISFEGAGAVYQGSSRAQTLVDKGGNDTITAGSGWDTVFAQGTDLRVQGGAGQTEFIDQTGHNHFTAGSGGAVVFGGPIGSSYQTGGDYFFLISTGGNDTVDSPAGTVAPIIFGAPNAVVHVASNAPGAFVVAGAGNETIDASASHDGVTFFGGSGNSDFLGGSGANFYAASDGNATMSGGSGNVYEFIDGHAGARYLISDFTPTDQLYLSGYGTAQGSGIVAEIVTNGTLAMTLSDGTSITFKNLDSPSQLDGRIHFI